jgi:hypothetical protein
MAEAAIDGAKCYRDDRATCKAVREVTSGL